VKAAIFSDLHLHCFQSFASIGQDGYNTRARQIGRVAMKIIDHASDLGCKAIFFAGDWFHVKKILAEELDLSGRILSRATALGLTVGMVPGNHDMAADGKVSPIHALRSFGSTVQLLDEAPLVFGKQGFTVAGVSYCGKREELLVKIKQVKKADLMILHAPCVGAEMASDLVQMDNEEAVGAEELIKASKAKLVVCGHYHKPQLFHEKQGWDNEIKGVMKGVRLLIPGAPLQHSFSDCGQIRGWWLLDTEGMSLEFKPIQEDTAIFEQKSYKEFLKDPGAVVGKYVSLQIPETLKQSVREEVVDAIRTASAGVRVDLVPVQKNAEKPRTDITPATHPTQAMSSYAEVNPPPDKKRTMQLGIRAIDLALQEKS
jgi:DNA repair exonuclease SbcCD nuclease subunit